MRAGLDLAEAGFKVHLCDRGPSIGGAAVQMDKWFPDSHCGLCQMLPVFDRDATYQTCLRRGLLHPAIEQLPLTEVEEVQGEAGDFTVTMKSQPRGVDPERCIGCGLCTETCPVKVSDDFERGLGSRKAIYLRHPLLPSNLYSIDWASCTKCGACVEKCPVDAIDLSQREEMRELKVGAIVLATGFEDFDPGPLTQYGHGRYPNVVNNLELERMLSPSGPFGGRLRRASDGEKPESVAFIQCAGSRDMDRGYCSSACCMYALKEAVLIKQSAPEVDVHIFYMDMRAFGKGFHRYYQEAEERWGVKFTRCRAPVLRQDFRTNDLLVNVPSKDGEPDVRRFGMVVLSTGQAPTPRFQELCHRLGVETNKWGFCRADALSPVDTTREGVYVCGAATGPKDIADTLCEAGACATRISQILDSSHNYKPAIEFPSLQADEAEEPRIAVMLCRCGDEIGESVGLDEVTRFAEALPSVSLVEEVPYLCQQDGLESAVAKLKGNGATGVVVAACSYFLNGKLSDIARESSLDNASIHGINLREEVAWVHDDRGSATEKASRLIAMAVERLKLQEARPIVSTDVAPVALVIGGGLAGLTSALTIADRGTEAHLVERSSHLGGNLCELYSTLTGDSPQDFLKDLIARAESNPHLRLHLETEVTGVEGYAGNYEATLRDKEGTSSVVNAGAIVVATGGQESRPREYLYGEAESVVTQRELDGKLARNEIDHTSVKSVAMIQCVGSRDEDRPYCSRICCSQALKNARALKEQVNEPLLGKELVVEPDLLVLSPAIVPGDYSKLAGMLDVELTQDGFFREAEGKFKPVETLRDGVFVCGLAHSPRDMSETIAQAQAAAQRALSMLSRRQLRSGGIVAEVNARRCSVCEVCIGVCHYNARVRDDDEGVVVVREALCRGCGACATACPNGAAQLRGFSERQVFAMMDTV
jgi:heterodisulfide reductase subunit A